jgi:PhnB protein
VVKAIPEGYTSLTPYLYVSDARRAIDFYTRAFGAAELLRMDGPDGRIGHAELRIGNARVMLADEHPEMGVRSPQAYGGTPISFLFYVDDVDRVFKQAIDAGGKEMRPLENRFYGDRTGMIQDPFGHQWRIATHVEDVPPEELQRRAAAQAPGLGT